MFGSRSYKIYVPILLLLLCIPGLGMADVTSISTSSNSKAQPAQTSTSTTNPPSPASTTTTDQQPPKVGNFILPATQQPNPLIGFGENILDKDQVQLSTFADGFITNSGHLVDLVPSVLYGISNNFSIDLNVPIALSYQNDVAHSSGLEDAFAQLEYAFYSKSTTTYTDQATVVSNITFPTGSANKSPSTGFGSPSFFVGGTFNRTYIHWFGFTSYGAVLTTSSNGTQFGNQYLYQGGFGRDLFTIGTDWLFAAMLEVDGQYSQKNRIYGAISPNSGGNVIYMTPSLWASSQHLILQLGLGLPAEQNLYGNQARNRYVLDGNISWTI